MIITQTPLRVGLVGGGTDLPGYYREHGGRVLNAAIDKYVYVIVKQRFDDDIYVNYSRRRSSAGSRTSSTSSSARPCTWPASGTASRSRPWPTSRRRAPGLGSSSSVTVGLLHALFAYQGKQLSAEELAERACTIEIDRCGKPIGKQDQYAAAYGGICDLRFGPGDRVVGRPDPARAAAAPAAPGRADALLHRHHPQCRHDPRRADGQRRPTGWRSSACSATSPARRSTALRAGDVDALGRRAAQELGGQAGAGLRRVEHRRSTRPSTPRSRPAPPAPRSPAPAAAGSCWSSARSSTSARSGSGSAAHEGAADQASIPTARG